MKNSKALRVLRIALGAGGTILLSVCALAFSAWMLSAVFLKTDFSAGAAPTTVADAAIMDRFNMSMTNRISTALDGILSIDKVYWLRDEDVIAPEPDQARFGETEDPASLEWLLEDAKELLDGQSTLFNKDIPMMPGTKVHYYLDDTIMVIVWKEKEYDVVYTVAEVKIAHPSQMRRFLAGNEYGHDKQYLTTKMAGDVNAVLGCSGDFYMYRQVGAVVYNGKVERADTSGTIDTCFIDDKGELIFSRKGELTEVAQTQKFVDEHNIRFSLSFGPILIEDGESCLPERYALGEITHHYPRAALCQADSLHYYVVTANCLDDYEDIFPTLETFCKFLMKTGCEKAYTLDGGQTATLSLNDEHINPVQYGSQRKISDIFYFATAMPNGG